MAATTELICARSRARRLAMQAVYQWQMTNQEVDEIINQFMATDYYAKIDSSYFKELLHAAISKPLDKQLEHCMEMSIEYVDPVERAILRNAAYEIACRADIDSAVAITEAIHLAKKFCGSESYRFINGVLDCFAKEYAAAQTE